ncbi:hypothetical protein N1851_014359 [Merluccius polli]|uniref:BED-type domain-containing protein n=1 Tax=Merluccius polli TaxID=89951 RepID=A0AA47MUE3_MERPO|nr:hypothetical protein N1851_014359 [Merluccius polli]
MNDCRPLLLLMSLAVVDNSFALPDSGWISRFVKGQLNCHVCDKVGLSRLDKHLADLHQLPPDSRLSRRTSTLGPPPTPAAQRDPPCDEDLNTGTLPTPTSPASQRDPPIDEDKASLELEESDSEEPEVGRPLKRRVVKRKLSFFWGGGGKKRGYYRPNAARHKV